MKYVTIYTDGACKGNPGPGGWAAILTFNGTEEILSGCDRYTTNNRMELLAVIEGLTKLNERCLVDLYTDSTYVKDGCKDWMHKWVKNDWKTSVGLPVRNQDLWSRLYDLYHQHDVHLFWVRGHSGHPMNERVDRLANRAMSQLFKPKKVPL
jgi:ribonuclease HI